MRTWQKVLFGIVATTILAVGAAFAVLGFLLSCLVINPGSKRQGRKYGGG